MLVEATELVTAVCCTSLTYAVLVGRVALAAAAAKHALLPWQAEHTEARTLTPLSKHSNAESLIAALLFTAHPIHTEAVAGIVGHAELLGAALGFAALLTYISAAKQPLRRQHDLQLAAAVGLLWLAALAKEIGITMVSCNGILRVHLMRDTLQADTCLHRQDGDNT